MPDRVLVIGGSGRTGRLVVGRLLEQERPVRVMSRRAAADDPRVGAVHGSITDAGAVRAAMRGCAGVVVSVEPPVDRAGAHATLADGVRLVAEIAREVGAAVVLVSQIYISRPKAYPAMTEVIRARAAGEQALRESGATYTIVRPSWLTDEPAGGGVRVEQGDRGDGEIGRDDVAAACVASLGDRNAHGKTFELYADREASAPDWPAIFARLAADQRQASS
jgi:uncharacterized protein YbjT (DUF2867 family)